MKKNILLFWTAFGLFCIFETMPMTFAEHGVHLTTSDVDEPVKPVVDTGQILCYNDTTEISCPSSGHAFYGQDSQYPGNPPGYTDNENNTVTDHNTGLVWQKSPDTNRDGKIDIQDKLTWSQLQTWPSTLNIEKIGGYSDWRLPTIKELYSLINFSGIDPSGYDGTDTSGLIPFIDTNYFDFAYGDTLAGERIIDAQYASETLYVATTNGMETLFGVNFADGRIKGYGLTAFGSEKSFYAICVRGKTYGANSFQNNGDGTLTDNATGLMWERSDSGKGLNWEDALALVAEKNAANHLGYSDWRLPNAKELQSIVDYTRSPDTSNSAAIDPLFTVSHIINEAGQADFPCYWAGTTHANWTRTEGSHGVYVAFGRAMGYMDGAWMDVHGAGAQRSDPKSGDPADYPTGFGPQGDAIRIYNYVRAVRLGQNIPVQPVQIGTEPGRVQTTLPADQVVELVINSTNNYGDTPVYEWLLFMASHDNCETPVYLLFDNGVVSLKDVISETEHHTLTFDSDGVMSFTTLSMTDLGLTSGDFFTYAYAYQNLAGLIIIDNIVIITVI